MDPDMVRQQAEAEREALALLQAKPARPTPPVTEPVLRASEAVAQSPVRVPLQATALKQASAGPNASPDARLPRFEAAAVDSAVQLQPPRQHSVAGRFGRFISYGLAGGMLGGGLGIVAVNYFDLPAELAKLAIFGPAGFFSIVCAIASFFTKAPEA